MATYDEIIAYAPLAAYLQNRDTVDEMPNIVRRAQTYITRRLDHDFFRQSVTGATVDEAGIVTIGLDEDELLEVRSISVVVGQRRHNTFPRDYDMLVSLFHDQRRGIPRYWAWNPDGEIQVFPAPGRALDLHISANVAEPVLAPGQQTNRISTLYPELMEQAVAMHVALFNLDPTAATLYGDQVTDLLTVANGQIGRQKRDETSQRPVETRNVSGS